MSGMLERLEAGGKMPTPPGVVLKLLELTRRDDTTARDLADTLAQDPVLAAKILRFANSPMAGIPREVTSLHRATAMIGVRGVKMMALSFAVLGADGAEACPGFDRKQFGVQSVACGVAAKMLASAAGIGSSQDAFMAGLLSQIGRSILAVGVPEEYAPVLTKASQIPHDLAPLETAAFDIAYPAVGAHVLRSWGLPAGLCDAIETFHDGENSNEAPPLVRLLSVAELFAGVICPDFKVSPPDPGEFVDAAEKILGIPREKCPELLSDMAAKIEETRATLEMPQGRMRPPAELQDEVRERIAELSLAMHMENKTMASRQEDLMRRATTDALTGIGNRAAFDARLSLELERSARSGAPFALMMIDIDQFKGFNDSHGHQAGDRVLQSAAMALDANVRKVDFVARYGGEEFAVITPETSAEGVLSLAGRLRRAVEETRVPWENGELSVTISVGVAVVTEVTEEISSEAIIKAADARLYAAKCAGRNRVELVVDGKSRKPAGAAS